MLDEQQPARQEGEAQKKALEHLAKVVAMMKEFYGLPIQVSDLKDFPDGRQNWVDQTIMSPTGHPVVEGLSIIWESEGRPLHHQDTIVCGTGRFKFDEILAIQLKRAWPGVGRVERGGGKPDR